MSREIIDNVLSKEVFEKIYNEFSGKNFPWFYSNTTTYQDSTGVVTDFKFSHIICGYGYQTTFATNIIYPVFEKLNVAAVRLCRAFLTTYTGQNVNHGFHSDASVETTGRPVFNYMKTAIYYINTNNGGTLFEDGQFVNSVENRLLIFNSQDRHAAITATDVAARIVVNINYF